MTRLSRTVLGVTLVTAGLAMMVLPGPGVVTVVAGLAVLGRDFPWAARWADSVRETAERWAPIRWPPIRLSRRELVPAVARSSDGDR